MSTHVADTEHLPVYSRRLREARESYGMSQHGLGIKAGLGASVASSRIRRYEAGARQPELPTLQRLANALGLPMAYFYAEDDELARLIAEFGNRAGRSPEQR